MATFPVPTNQPAPLSPLVPLNSPMVGFASPFDHADGQNRDLILEAIRTWASVNLLTWSSGWQAFFTAWIANVDNYVSTNAIQGPIGPAGPNSIPVDTAIANFIATASLTRGALIKRESYARPVDFGAIGDGITDDTAALVRTFAASNYVELHPGAVYLTDPIVLAAGSTISAYGATIKGRTGTGNVLTAASNCTILGGTIDGNNTVKTGGSGITATTGSNLTIRDVTIQNCIGKGIDITAITDYSVTGCWVKNVGGQGINVTIANRGRIAYNTVDTAAHGIQWWGGDAAVASAVGIEFLTITGNVVRNITGGGIWGSLGGHISVTGNSVKTCGDVGIDIEGGGSIAVTGNTVVDCVTAALAVFYGPAEVVFSSNTITQTAGKGPGIKAVGGGMSIRISAIGNTITTTGQPGIFYESLQVSDSLITGNDITALGVGALGLRLRSADLMEIDGNIIRTDQPTGIQIEGGADNGINDNRISHTGTADASAGGSAGGIRVIWISATATGKRTRIRGNNILGFVTGINDDCGGDNASGMLVENNSLNTIYHRGTVATGWNGLIVNARTIADPNVAATIVAF